MIKRVVLALVLISFLFGLASAQEQPWCGITTLYFQQNTTGASLPGYEELINRPSGNTEIDESLTISSANSWVEFDRYMTPEFALDGTAEDLEGLRRYRFYSYVSSNVGTTQLNFTPYIYRNGALIDKFYSAESEDINSLTVNEYLLSHVSNTSWYFQKGDRIVIIVSAKTTQPAPITVHWVYQGATHTSHVESGYFVCEESTDYTTEAAAAALGLIGGSMGGVLFIKKRREK